MSRKKNMFNAFINTTRYMQNHYMNRDFNGQNKYRSLT